MPVQRIKKKIQINLDLSLYNWNNNEVQTMLDLEFDLKSAVRELEANFAGEVTITSVEISDVPVAG
jgi:hypothetical protein